MANPIPFCGDTPCNALPAIQVPVQEASGTPVSENSSVTLHELLTILRRRGRLSPGMSRDDLLKEVLRIAPDVGLAMDLADLIIIKKRSEPEIHAGWRSEGAMPPARSNAPSVSLGDAANDPESAAIVKGAAAPAPRGPEAIKTNIPSPKITPTAMGTGQAASAPKATGTPIGGLIGKGWPEPPGFMAPIPQKKQEVSSVLHPHETSQHEVHGPVNAGHPAYLDALKKEKLGHYQDWHESTGPYIEKMPKSGNVAAAKRGGMVDPGQLYGPPGKQHSEQLGKHLEEFLARGLYHLAEKHKDKPAALATRIGHLTDLLESHKLGHGEHGKLLGHYLEGGEHADSGDKLTEPTTTKYPGGQHKEYMQGHKDLYEAHIEQLHNALNALDEKLTASDPDAVARQKELAKHGIKNEDPEIRDVIDQIRFATSDAGREKSYKEENPWDEDFIDAGATVGLGDIPEEVNVKPETMDQSQRMIEGRIKSKEYNPESDNLDLLHAAAHKEPKLGQWLKESGLESIAGRSPQSVKNAVELAKEVSHGSRYLLNELGSGKGISEVMKDHSRKVASPVILNIDPEQLTKVFKEKGENVEKIKRAGLGEEELRKVSGPHKVVVPFNAKNGPPPIKGKLVIVPGKGGPRDVAHVGHVESVEPEGGGDKGKATISFAKDGDLHEMNPMREGYDYGYRGQEEPTNNFGLGAMGKDEKRNAGIILGKKDHDEGKWWGASAPYLSSGIKEPHELDNWITVHGLNQEGTTPLFLQSQGRTQLTGGYETSDKFNRKFGDLSPGPRGQSMSARPSSIAILDMVYDKLKKEGRDNPSPKYKDVRGVLNDVLPFNLTLREATDALQENAKHVPSHMLIPMSVGQPGQPVNFDSLEKAFNLVEKYKTFHTESYGSVKHAKKLADLMNSDPKRVENLVLGVLGGEDESYYPWNSLRKELGTDIYSSASMLPGSVNDNPEKKEIMRQSDPWSADLRETDMALEFIRHLAKKERDKAGETPQPWKAEHPEDEPSWKVRANPLSPQKDIDALHDHFESKSPREYKNVKPYVDRVVANLPAHIIDRVRTNTSGGMKVYDSASDVHDSFMSIYDEGVKNNGWPKVDWGKGKICGFYVATDGGSLHITRLVKNGNDYTDHAIAHEMAHAVDGPGCQLSSREAFRTAWDREIVHGGNVSKYAAKNPREGFAEFARCVWSGNVDKETLWRDTSQLMKFFEFHGLLPEDMRMKDGSQGKKSFAKDRNRVRVEEIFKDSVSLPDGTTGDIFLDDDSQEKGKSNKDDVKTEE